MRGAYRVIAYHLILSAYGFWLPNDPRGSWSDFVRSWELLRYGRATKVNHGRSVARVPHDRRARLEAKRALRYQPVRFTGEQAWCVAKGFEDYARRSGLIIHACAVLPDHAHLVVARHTCAVEQVARLLKQSAAVQLQHAGLHPFARHRYADRRHPSPWARGEWKVFIVTDEHLRAAVRYVNDNPLKESLPRQHWSFVTPLDGS